MKTVFVGTRSNLEPGKETYTSLHKGTHEYLTKIRCDKIDPRSAEEVEDSACNAEGRYVGASGQAIPD